MGPPARLRVGEWCVDPAAGQISRGGEVVRIEARTLRLLLDLAERQGQVVSIDELLDRVWAGVIVTPDSVYQAVATLRRLLGDDPKRPRYIATVPRLGYRMVSPVTPWSDDAPSTPPRPAAKPPPRRTLAALAGLGSLALAAVVIVAGQSTRGPVAAKAPQPAAVGVMPFLDLTKTMDNEILADDLTEGVIDRLAKNPSLRTPGFRDTFLLKGKHLRPAQAAQALGVGYILDGSLHSAPAGFRVDARLVRADNGFVIWSQAFEGPASEAPHYEDAIAAGIGDALRR
jgi:DNA-binding winged helix-turn-helix (wHTH) protein/TolB-like protein